jgi:N utilization substance protein B
MLSRRLLRIKILQVIYAFFKASNATIQKSEKELFHSIKKSYDLYYYLFILILDIALYDDKKIQLAREKRVPSAADLNPNMNFVNNRVINQIRENNQISIYVAENKLNWQKSPELIKKIYNHLITMDFYKEYMAKKTLTFKDEKQLVIDFYSRLVPEFDDLHGVLEEQSIYWNDDLDFVLAMIVKTLGKFKEKNTGGASMMPMYKNEDDKDFVKKLFRKSILNFDENEKFIKEVTKNWDVERIAFMDILIMQLAITEVMEFPSIPTKVSLNEYIEISKYYSTEKSSIFINGILDKVFIKLKNENKINKQGRGLIGEI